MTDPVVRPITPADFDAVLDVLVRAFEDDPWFTFVATQDAHRHARLRDWLRRGLVKRTYPRGETYIAADGTGVALWIPPSAPGDARFAEIELWWALLRTAGVRRAHTVREAIRTVLEHEPALPHRELRIIAVAPEHQGRGIGAALVRPMLDQCDSEHLGAALLCTKARNVALYRRFGFEVTSEFTIPNGPTLWHMWREPVR